MNSKPKVFMIVILMICSFQSTYAQNNGLVEGKNILIYFGRSNLSFTSINFQQNYTNAGNTVTMTDNYDFSSFETDGYNALFLTGTQNLTTSEIGAITMWFNQGGKMLWVGGDSDFNGYYKADEINPLLSSIGTGLRIDGGSIEDSVVNDGAPYRVLANKRGPNSGLVEYVMQGVSYAAFHGPTAISWFNGVNYVDLRSMTLPESVDIVITSSENAISLDSDLSLNASDFYASNPITGNYPMVATERIGNSMVVASGESIFSDYKKMYDDFTEKKTLTLHHQGKLLVDRLLKYFFYQFEGRPVQLDQLVHAKNILIYTGQSVMSQAAFGFEYNYTIADCHVLVTRGFDLPGLYNHNFDVVMLHGTMNLSPAELNGIAQWFDQGGKLLWVAGDSDYGGYFQASQTNPIMESVGSVLRLDAGSIEDSVYNDGAAYRVVANTKGPSSELTDYVMPGVQYAPFHGPTGVMWYDGANYQDLRYDVPDKVDVVIKSSPSSYSFDSDLSADVIDFYSQQTEQGGYPMLATEKIGKSMIVVGGEASFTDYKRMYGNTFERGTLGTGHQGGMIVDRLLKYFFEVYEPEFVPILEDLPSGKNIMIYTGRFFYERSADGFYANYSASGNNVFVTNNYDFSNFEDADFDALFLTGTMDLLPSELQAIDAWFSKGNRFLWVGGDSDFAGNVQSALINPILGQIGTGLRLDGGSVEDQTYNDGAAYRVIANTKGPSSELTDYVMKDVELVPFHGPTSVVWNDGFSYVDLRTMSLPGNVDIVIKSSENAIVLDSDVSQLPEDFYANQDMTGGYPMLATERIGSSMVIVSGESLFNDYKFMYGNTMEIGVLDAHHQGGLLVDRLINYFFSTHGVNYNRITEDLTTGKDFLVYTGRNFYGRTADGFQANYTAAGNSVLVTDTYDFSNFGEATFDALFLTATIGLESNEIEAINAWFNKGNRLLWIAADSDYAGNFQSPTINPVFEGLGSGLRFDAGSIQDDIFNDGAAYRVIANTKGPSSELTDYVMENVRFVPFHGPTSIVWHNGNSLVDFRYMGLSSEVSIIMQASSFAYALDGDLSSNPIDFYAQQSQLGNYPMLAAEQIDSSLVIASGEALFNDYKFMYGTHSEFGALHPYHQGGLVVDRIIKYYFDIMEKDDPVTTDPDDTTSDPKDDTTEGTSKNATAPVDPLQNLGPGDAFLPSIFTLMVSVAIIRKKKIIQIK
ncbi:MAG: hypothetical protein INQ03_12905 [Candidatus Heimdallarchaeota archaeon]|nr:hypothetical protein [Candidatus Heimdallarchaeota archaeon]